MFDAVAASAETALPTCGKDGCGFWQLFFAFLINIFNSPQAGAGAISILLVVSGLSLVRTAKSDSPFASLVLPILGLTFILPCIIFSAIILEPQPSSELIITLIGTIAGYVFGSLRTQSSLGLPASKPTQGQENMSEEKTTPSGLPASKPTQGQENMSEEKTTPSSEKH